LHNLCAGDPTETYANAISQQPIESALQKARKIRIRGNYIVVRDGLRAAQLEGKVADANRVLGNGPSGRIPVVGIREGEIKEEALPLAENLHREVFS